MVDPPPPHKSDRKTGRMKWMRLIIGQKTTVSVEFSGFLNEFLSELDEFLYFDFEPLERGVARSNACG